MAMENSYSIRRLDGHRRCRSRTTSCPRPPARTRRDNVSAPPTAFVIDLSNPIPFGNYSSDAPARPLGQLADARRPTATSARWARAAWEPRARASRSSPGTTVTLYNYNVAATGDHLDAGRGRRLGQPARPPIAAGSTLPADYYRLYMPNQVDAGGTDTRIFDIYGNQLDGEFLGNQTSPVPTEFQPGSPSVTLPQYQDEQTDGTFRRTT